MMTLQEIKDDIRAIKRHNKAAVVLGWRHYGRNTQEAISERMKASAIERKYQDMINGYCGYPEGNEIIDFLDFFVAMTKKIEEDK